MQASKRPHLALLKTLCEIHGPTVPIGAGILREHTAIGKLRNHKNYQYWEYFFNWNLAGSYLPTNLLKTGTLAVLSRALALTVLYDSPSMQAQNLAPHLSLFRICGAIRQYTGSRKLQALDLNV